MAEKDATDSKNIASSPSRDPRRSRDAAAAEAAVRNGNIFSRIWIFIRQVIAELKKVIWPTRNELWTYFWVVIIFVMILMTAIFLFDYFFAWVTNLVFA